MDRYTTSPARLAEDSTPEISARQHLNGPAVAARA
jgi:hypothetical protein